MDNPSTKFIRHFIFGSVLIFFLWLLINAVLAVYKTDYYLIIPLVGLLFGIGLFLLFTTYFRLWVTVVQFILTVVLSVIVNALLEALYHNSVANNGLPATLQFITIATIGLTVTVIIKLLLDKLFFSLGCSSKKSHIEKILEKHFGQTKENGT